MLPLADHNPRRTAPVVNIILVIVNVLIFFWEVSLGPRLEPVLFNVAFVPARFWNLPGELLPNVITMFVSMFLHGGWLHLGGNMLYLWIFGDNIEDRLGHGKYLFFYFACGLLATLAHAVMNPASEVPSIGASGAIAGVLGAYIVLFPKQRVTTLIPIFIFITVRENPRRFPPRLLDRDAALLRRSIVGRRSGAFRRCRLLCAYRRFRRRNDPDHAPRRAATAAASRVSGLLETLSSFAASTGSMLLMNVPLPSS